MNTDPCSSVVSFFAVYLDVTVDRRTGEILFLSKS